MSSQLRGVPIQCSDLILCLKRQLSLLTKCKRRLSLCEVGAIAQWFLSVPSETHYIEFMSDTQTQILGHEVIQSYLKSIDGSPGVYRMLDSESRVLYVGKARNLKARVSSYARPTGHSGRIARMISMTASMMFLTTRTETEALLLEQNLIKQLKPKFNVLLRDDKSFPNILVSQGTDFPQIKKHRGAKKETGSYYGPFASAGAVNRTLNQLQRVFLLRNCSDSMFDSRTRPCLLHQIKRCSAPCVDRISKEDYAISVRDAERFLQGKSTDVQAKLADEMQRASDEMEFERAAALRDRIKAMTSLQTAQGINPRGVDEADIVALHMEQGRLVCRCSLSVRGRIGGTKISILGSAMTSTQPRRWKRFWANSMILKIPRGS